MVQRFAADFQWLCSNTAIPQYGELRYNATIPLTSLKPPGNSLPHPFQLKAQTPVQANALVQTADGDVDVYADVGATNPDGATITVLGPIVANQSTVHGTDENDTVIIGVVDGGSPMTVNAGAGDDTVNVGTPAPGTVDGISCPIEGRPMLAASSRAVCSTWRTRWSRA